MGLPQEVVITLHANLKHNPGQPNKAVGLVAQNSKRYAPPSARPAAAAASQAKPPSTRGHGGTQPQPAAGVEDGDDLLDVQHAAPGGAQPVAVEEDDDDLQEIMNLLEPEPAPAAGPAPGDDRVMLRAVQWRRAPLSLRQCRRAGSRGKDANSNERTACAAAPLPSQLRC